MMTRAMTLVTLMLTAVCTHGALKESEVSPTFFKAQKMTVETVFRATVSLSTAEVAELRARKNLYWAVNAALVGVDDDARTESVVTVVERESLVGKKVLEILKDGKEHKALVAVRYRTLPADADDKSEPEICELTDMAECGRGWTVLAEGETAEAGAGEVTDITARLTKTRLTVMKGNECDYVQGKIGMQIRSSQKFFAKPLLRVVLLVDENGSRAVRDMIVHDPDIKVVEEITASNWMPFTTTMPGVENAPDSRCRTIKDISEEQAEVAREKYAKVEYEGVWLGTQNRHGVKGNWVQTLLGYSVFDRDEKAKILGYRIEVWYKGVCVESYDSLSASKRKSLQLPDDWHVSFKYPTKFAYKSPWASKKTASR